MQAKIPNPRFCSWAWAPLYLHPPVPNQLLSESRLAPSASANWRGDSAHAQAHAAPPPRSPPCQGEHQNSPPSHTPSRIQRRISRRSVLQAGGIALPLLPNAAAFAQTPSSSNGAQQALPAPQPGLSRQACLEKYAPYLQSPDYWKEGPLQAVRLPIKLSHVLTSCYSNGFAGTSCQVKFDMFYPKGGATLGLGPPYPLALITSGFLVSSEAYKSYAQRLASWGYAVLLYDKQETMSEILDDVTSVAALRQCIDLAASDPLIKRVADPSRVYLVGHSRGGKISALAALEDPRVFALCLLDPVDNTVYAPLAPGFPSAVAALQGTSSPEGIPISSSSSSSDGSKSRSSRGSQAVSSSSRNSCVEGSGETGEDGTSGGGIDGVGGMGDASTRTGVSACASLPASFPVAVVGSGIGGDCAPSDANYQQFFNATRGPAWLVSIKNAGHFQYLDVTSPLQSYLCPAGSAPDDEVRHIACGVMVAWAELCLRHRGRDVLRGAPPADTQASNGSAPSISSASTAAKATSDPISSSQKGAGVSGNGSGIADRMLRGKGGPFGMISFEDAPGVPGSSGESQGPGDRGSGGREGGSSINSGLYPYTCSQDQGLEAPADRSSRSAPGMALPWDMPGLRREARDVGSNREGTQSNGMGNLQPTGRPVSFDSSLPESLDAALRGQRLRGVDVATKYKAFSSNV